jgi:hypothetical protein
MKLDVHGMYERANGLLDQMATFGLPDAVQRALDVPPLVLTLNFGRWGEEFIYLDYCGLESEVDGCYYCHDDDWRDDNPCDLLYTSSL